MGRDLEQKTDKDIPPTATLIFLHKFGFDFRPKSPLKRSGIETEQAAHRKF